jgi:hypothetical protein
MLRKRKRKRRRRRRKKKKKKKKMMMMMRRRICGFSQQTVWQRVGDWQGISEEFLSFLQEFSNQHLW